eukprot:EG_transcript_17337
MDVSVYVIYVVACLLACGAAVFTGIVLIKTFDKQQQASENVQLRTGIGQVRAVQSAVRYQMSRMQTATDSNAKQFFFQTASLPASTFTPNNIVAALNHSVFANWAPVLAAPNQLNGFGMSFIYTNQTTGQIYDRSLQAYWTGQKSGVKDFAYATTSLVDNLSHIRRVEWRNAQPVLGGELGSYEIGARIAGFYTKDNFFQGALPWVAMDGNSFWCFTYLRAFTVHGVPMLLQTWNVATAWLDMMQSALTPNANLIAFDSQRFVISATTPSELLRMSTCQSSVSNGFVDMGCIATPADQHPNAEIRALYTALHLPAWDDTNEGPIDPTMTKLSLRGQQYMAISATLFSADELRTIIVWYQPWVVLE